MSESRLHKQRVRGMVRWMEDQGVQVTHAAGGLALPDPHGIGRHEPDALGSKDGVLWIGEAKVGTELDTRTAREQFEDFSNRQMKETGLPCPFILSIPKGYEEQARHAVLDAGGSTANLTIIS